MSSSQFILAGLIAFAAAGTMGCLIIPASPFMVAGQTKAYAALACEPNDTWKVCLDKLQNDPKPIQATTETIALAGVHCNDGEAWEPCLNRVKALRKEQASK